MGWFGKADGAVEHVSIKAVKWGDQQPKHKLSRCPECGSERVDLWYVGAAEGGWRVICSDCHYLPDRLCRTEEEAVNLWNEVR